MVHIKVLCANENGKFEFTKDELEEMLNSAYDDGKSENYLAKMTEMMKVSSAGFGKSESAQESEN